MATAAANPLNLTSKLQLVNRNNSMRGSTIPIVPAKKQHQGAGFARCSCRVTNAARRQRAYRAGQASAAAPSYVPPPLKNTPILRIKHRVSTGTQNEIEMERVESRLMKLHLTIVITTLINFVSAISEQEISWRSWCAPAPTPPAPTPPTPPPAPTPATPSPAPTPATTHALARETAAAVVVCGAFTRAHQVHFQQLPRRFRPAD
jgi:hypothetical protein